MRRIILSLTLLATCSTCLLAQAAPAQAQEPPAAVRDPQAVTVVQAAIDALGGATAIAQHQSWTFRGTAQGPMSSGNVHEIASLNPEPSNSSSGTAPSTPLIPFWLRPHLRFIPALVGTLLLRDFQNAAYSIEFLGPETVGAQAVTAVRFAAPLGPTGAKLSARIYCFDTSTNLPARVVFDISTQVGNAVISPAIVDFSDYQSVSGVNYPFRITTNTPVGMPPEVITIQSLKPSPTARLILPRLPGSAAQKPSQ